MNSKTLFVSIAIIFIAGCTSPKEPGKHQQHSGESLAPVESKTDSKKPFPPRLVKPQIIQRENSLAMRQVKKTANTGIALSRSTLVIADGIMPVEPPRWNRESYDAVQNNGFVSTLNDPLSTFSIDVDTASYSNVRRFINQGQKPPIGAVRTEEMINYFSYSYPQPTGDHPFSVTTELGPCFWNTNHQLVRIGLKAKDIDKKKLPPSNLVFLIDVSGSMSSMNKLPLLKQSMKMLVNQLDQNDRVSIVVYAGSDDVTLLPTPGSEHERIITAIDMLGAGGATHASSGIVTAYQLAEQAFIPNGNNRIILASDGDFNVGVTSRGELAKLIENKRQSGIYLTILGFGVGNYHDDTMEILADKGNGNYAYIDNILEAKKVMVKEMNGTIFALARDVKIQVEFNPAKVAEYRLVGYENRALADKDFNDDTKDAGEIGIGHTVTALYELIPTRNNDLPVVDDIKYQQVKPRSNSSNFNELMTVKLRYKPLHKEQSRLLTTVVTASSPAEGKTSIDFRFATAVAAYSMLLRGDEGSSSIRFGNIIALAKDAKGKDNEGYRSEFIRLVEMTQLLP